MLVHDGLLESDFTMGGPNHREAALLWGIDPDSRDPREFREITVQKIAVGDDGDVRGGVLGHDGVDSLLTERACLVGWLFVKRDAWGAEATSRARAVTSSGNEGPAMGSHCSLRSNPSATAASSGVRAFPNIDRHSRGRQPAPGSGLLASKGQPEEGSGTSSLP